MMFGLGAGANPVQLRNLLQRNAFLQQQLLLEQQQPEEPKPFNHFKPHKLFEERPIPEWTESDVLQWWDHPTKGPQIPDLHKEKYRPLLKANRVNGQALLMLDSDGWSMLGISGTDFSYMQNFFFSYTNGYLHPLVNVVISN